MTVKRDKILHVETAMLIVVIVSLLFPVWVGAIVAAVASIGKEVWDKYHGGVPSWADLSADLIGVGLGTVLAWLTIVCNTFV